MKRRLAPIVVAAAAVLTACGSSAPPAKELANELIDTMDLSDEVKACMHREVDEFQLTEEQAQGFTDFDDVAAKAAGGNELAKQVIDDFEAALASCR